MIGDERQAIFFVGYADRIPRADASRPPSRGETFTFSGSGGEVTNELRMHDFDP